MAGWWKRTRHLSRRNRLGRLLLYLWTVGGNVSTYSEGGGAKGKGRTILLWFIRRCAMHLGIVLTATIGSGLVPRSFGLHTRGFNLFHATSEHAGSAHVGL